MNRKYTRQVFLETVERLCAACPDFTVTTDVIVGFPGETETDFQDTLDVVHSVQFAKVHMFPFSPRPRTRAALMPNPVPIDVIRERKQRLMHGAEQAAFKLREAYAGLYHVRPHRFERKRTHREFSLRSTDRARSYSQPARAGSARRKYPQGLLGKVV